MESAFVDDFVVFWASILQFSPVFCPCYPELSQRQFLNGLAFSVAAPGVRNESWWDPLGPRSGWPKSSRALAGRLRRAQTPLRALGIEIVFGREGRLGTRTIRITAMGENRTHDTVSTVSRVSDHGDRAGLNHPPPGLEQAL